MDDLKSSLEECLLLSYLEYDINMNVIDILNLVRTKINKKLNINIREIKFDDRDMLSYLEIDEIKKIIDDFEDNM